MKFLLPLILFAFSGFAWGQKVEIYTEEFAPFNFTEKGKTVGASTEIIEAVMKAAGLDYKIKVYPWARTYDKAKKGKNSFIYSISRRPAREKEWIWVDKIVPANYAVFALKDTARSSIKKSPIPNLGKLDDLKKFVIGTTVDDAREAYLLANGFTKKDFQRVANKDPHRMNLKKLLAGRIDTWPMPTAVAAHLVKKVHNKDIGDMLKVVYPLDDLSGGYFLAASNQTDQAIVKKVRDAINKLRTEGFLDKVSKKWNL